MSDNQKKQPLIVKCPSCEAKVEWTDLNDYRPFCSNRCQQIDLGAWSSEEYAIPAEPTEEWSGDNNSISDQHSYTLQ